VSVTIKDSTGKAVKNASVTIRFTIMENNGTVITTVDRTGTTDSSGRLTLSASGKAPSGKAPRKASFTITTVTATNFQWDGKNATTTASD
jgi:hypothetical protein